MTARLGAAWATLHQGSAAPVSCWGDTQLLGPDRKETSPLRSVTQTRWGCTGVQACGVVTDRNRPRAAAGSGQEGRPWG